MPLLPFMPTIAAAVMFHSEGDHDRPRVFVEVYLAVVERVLPERFRECITAQQVFAKQPGPW
jgi:hypothetical protein